MLRPWRDFSGQWVPRFRSRHMPPSLLYSEREQQKKQYILRLCSCHQRGVVHYLLFVHYSSLSMPCDIPVFSITLAPQDVLPFFVFGATLLFFCEDHQTLRNVHRPAHKKHSIQKETKCSAHRIHRTRSWSAYQGLSDHSRILLKAPVMESCKTPRKLQVIS